VGFVAQDQQLVVVRLHLRHDPALRICGFLYRMLMPLAVGRPGPVPFIRTAVIGMIDADDGNADRPFITASKMLHLLDEVAHDPINLLDHGLGENLDLCADLDGRHRAACNLETSVVNGLDTRNELAEGPVATT
jgi:hypothetical protein